MALDILIPFLILLILVIYLIYTRSKFEKNILNLYEKKFEEWKKNTTVSSEEKSYKKLVGLLFEEDYRLKIEFFDKKVEDRLKRAKFDIKFIGKDYE